MKKISALLLSMALAFTSVYAAAFEKSLKQKSLKVELISQKPLTAGTNHIKVKLYKSSKPLDGAKVALKIFMPAMPGMPYMESRAKAKPVGNGVYELHSMRRWEAHGRFTSSLRQMRVKNIV